MKVYIGSELRIYEPTQDVIRWARENLVIDNPEYIKKMQLGKWTGNTPRQYSLYAEQGGTLRLPFGCLKHIWQLHPHKNDYELKIADLKPVKYESSINIYPYQEEAVRKAISAKNGIIVMPCGAGKTQSALELIARIGGRALWLTHTQDLLNQSKKRAESVLDIGSGTFGTITGGKINIGTHITFATVQTMINIDLESYKDAWDIIVVDECQHCVGSPTKMTQFYKVLNSLSARYKIGLTATPKRADGLQKSMFYILGDIIHEVKRSDVKDTTCPIKVEFVQTNWMPEYREVLLGDGTIDYSKLIVAMTSDEKRRNLIVDMTYQCTCVGPTMVLANRVEYLQKMCDDYNHNQCGTAICISGTGQSKKAKEERKKAFEALNNREIDCIFCTYQLAAEGLDVPHLRYIVFATPEKNETTVVQAVGRVGRRADDKSYGTVIDFVDNFGMYHGWATKRYGYYKKINAEIE